MTNNVLQYTLNDGLKVPAVGFGTDVLKGAKGVLTIIQALNNGYRFLDTAYAYENEATVGKAVKESGLSRQEILISSKLPEKYHQYDLAVPAIQESLFRAGLDYYDIYLIHWPDPKQDKFVEAWQALIDAQKWGLVRSIGVSNFQPDQLKRLKDETGVMPVINQIQTHPYFTQDDMLKANEEHNILTQSWSPLGNRMADDLLDNDTLREIGNQYDKSIGQVILRWHVQNGYMPIPRSSSPVRQKDNLTVFNFDLSDQDMKAIASLSRPDGNIYG